MTSRTIGSLLFILFAVACGGDGSSTTPTNQAPSATFTALITNLSALVNASDSSDPDGNITSFSWDFGDSNTATGITATHNYSQAGTYTITLTVTDNQGATAATSQVLTVSAPNQLPTAAFTVSSNDLSISVDASDASDPDGNITSFSWDFGDGNTATGITATHSFSQAGSYNITLTVTDNQRATHTTTSAVTVTNATFSLSGTITSAVNTAVDGDVNDPVAQVTDNNDINNPQQVPAPLQLNGYVTFSATNNPGDVFRNSTDIDDYYTANLLGAQFVSLRVADFDNASPTSVDIDLALRDANGAIVAQSLSVTEFESVQVPADGRHIIQVRAFSGSSKYILSIGSTSLGGNAIATNMSLDIVPGEVIIKFRDSQALSHMQALGVAQFSSIENNAPVLMKITDIPLASKKLNNHSSVTSFSEAQSSNHQHAAVMATLRMVKTLNSREDVIYAEPNRRLYPLLTPNDNFYNLQWHYPTINLPQAWDITTGTPNSGDVIIAVVDTGVVLGHQDLANKLVDGYDFISDPDNADDGDGIDSNPDDPGDNANLSIASWHGTHVAGTVGADSNNNQGVAGVSWGARIMPIRALGINGGAGFDVIQGVRYAAGLSNDSNTVPSQRADVINLSLGGGGFSQAEQETFNEVRAAGVIVVAAAGNENTSTISYPAGYDGVISVVATDLRNQLAPYSNFGSTVDVAAPGGDSSIDVDGDGATDGVLSTAIESNDNVSRNDAYVYYQGTSMASPHMAGVVALMKAIHPELTPDDVDSLLINGDITIDLGAQGRDDTFGHGLIDALRAVQAAQTLAGGVQTGALTINPRRIDFGRVLNSATVNVTPLGNAPPNVTRVEANQAFVTVDTSAADTNGAGVYTLNVNRTDLADGIYNATVTFFVSSGSDTVLNLSMEVGTVFGVVGNTGALFLLLLNPANTNNLGQLELTPTNGEYNYQFDNLDARDYIVVVGSDVDNDGRICGIAEICGAYPTLSEIQTLALNANRTGINFGAQVTIGVNTNNASGLFSVVPVENQDNSKNPPAENTKEILLKRLGLP